MPLVPSSRRKPTVNWRTGKSLTPTWCDPLQVKFSPETSHAVREAARLAKCPVSEWIRRACEERLARDVGTEG